MAAMALVVVSAFTGCNGIININTTPASSDNSNDITNDIPSDVPPFVDEDETDETNVFTKVVLLLFKY